MRLKTGVSTTRWGPSSFFCSFLQCLLVGHHAGVDSSGCVCAVTAWATVCLSEFTGCLLPTCRRGPRGCGRREKWPLGQGWAPGCSGAGVRFLGGLPCRCPLPPPPISVAVGFKRGVRGLPHVQHPSRKATATSLARCGAVLGIGACYGG